MPLLELRLGARHHGRYVQGRIATPGFKVGINPHGSSQGGRTVGMPLLRLASAQGPLTHLCAPLPGPALCRS